MNHRTKPRSCQSRTTIGACVIIGECPPRVGHSRDIGHLDSAPVTESSVSDKVRLIKRQAGPCRSYHPTNGASTVADGYAAHVQGSVNNRKHPRRCISVYKGVRPDTCYGENGPVGDLNWSIHDYPPFPLRLERPLSLIHI